MAKLLRKKEQDKINNLISNFEQNTHSELLIIINKRSDPYPGASLRFGIAMAISITLIISVFLELQYAFFFPLITLVTFFVFTFIGRWSPLQRWVLTESEKSREVSEKALELFFLHGPGRVTHKATSMIYFSVLERKIHLVVDQVINKQFESNDIQKIIEIIEDEFKQKNYYEGLETAIESLERLILYYFPSKVLPHKPNELENQITHL